MYGDRITAKERTSKKGAALHKAILNKIDKRHIKAGIKGARERLERESK